LRALAGLSKLSTDKTAIYLTGSTQAINYRMMIGNSVTQSGNQSYACRSARRTDIIIYCKKCCAYAPNQFMSQRKS
tara:strand:+ start:586258 stop:586485 length:228 start_codon:yes stop_codon:yes gene_type:complete